ncbi:DNA mismatch repair protein mutL [Gemmatirosa kalamazoonensis]|uniref:DNA mismatch repair protein MutL n=1 Tax=Gemmatirosa kalamazoonensis TaxID=861299 RepID=W0RJU9_9BACT|nr:DNA mismatch repair endonuclease MutL [Gemmatirosa kalamazoonensis]AHG90692.1 DNA mismatch repair protein mutL [Gemmatirosa kalamazoonensis]
MPHIAILPSAVADQIAAGEVVERPASVVKELVENALDAGATSVDVVVESGGRTLVRVSDDGSGMSRDDAVLALARHATSKIRRAEDLVGVRSFGFRGEALPAICSVSHLDIETATADGEGTRVTAEGGTVQEVRDAARRRGTTVSVARLFYNAPAREKFMRSTRSEWRGISDAVVTAALVRRDVRFTLTHDGRPALALPAAPSLRSRVAAIFGARYADALVDVDDVAGAIGVCGLVERPADVGTASRRVFLVVNGRAVRDAGIVRAAEAAYRSTLPSGVRPSLFLDVTLPADEVDVNVHPAKAEVRFRDRWTVERAVERAVRRALGTPDSAADVGRAWQRGLLGDATPRPIEVDRSALRVDAPPPGGLFAADVDVADAPASVATAMREPEEEIAVPPLTQLRRTYMLFERDDGVVLIDQHSAHERVLYEQFMGALERGEAPSQRLLFPLTLHLGPAQGDAFDEHRDLFARLGFEVEGFGGHTLLVHSVPTPHPRFDAERCLRETLDTLTGDRHVGVHARHERLAATVACKAAIKAGDPLSLDEMRALFVALARTTLPAHDVHGRSTIVQLGWDEVDRRFGRR